MSEEQDRAIGKAILIVLLLVFVVFGIRNYAMSGRIWTAKASNSQDR